jgi:hypothetical protein
VGSVGTRASILLMDGANAADPLVLQAKEAQRSVLADFVPTVTPQTIRVNGSCTANGSPR